MVADEDKLVGETERAEARRQRHLRRLIDDAHVEAALDEDRPVEEGVSEVHAQEGRRMRLAH